jgi:hypothetical protein
MSDREIIGIAEAMSGLAYAICGAMDFLGLLPG